MSAPAASCTLGMVKQEAGSGRPEPWPAVMGGRGDDDEDDDGFDGRAFAVTSCGGAALAGCPCNEPAVSEWMGELPGPSCT